MHFAISHICDRHWKIMMIANKFLKYLHRRPRYSILNFWPLGGFLEASTTIFSFLTFNLKQYLFTLKHFYNENKYFTIFRPKEIIFEVKILILSQNLGLKILKIFFIPLPWDNILARFQNVANNFFHSTKQIWCYNFTIFDWCNFG